MNCHLVHETGITDTQIEAVSRGVEAVGRHLKQVGQLTIVRHQVEYLPRFGDPRIVDSDSVMRASEQIYAEDLAVVVTQRDLGASLVPGVLFGDALFGRGKSIVSNYYPEGNVSMLKVLTAHVMAHSVGLVKSSAKNHDTSALGQQQAGRNNHCKNDCIMKPISQKRHLAEAARLMDHQPHSSGFCKACVGLLHSAHLERKGQL